MNELIEQAEMTHRDNGIFSFRLDPTKHAFMVEVEAETEAEAREKASKHLDDLDELGYKLPGPAEPEPDEN